jgi:hypothetical protein
MHDIYLKYINRLKKLVKCAVNIITFAAQNARCCMFVPVDLNDLIGTAAEFNFETFKR